MAQLVDGEADAINRVGAPVEGRWVACDVEPHFSCDNNGLCSVDHPTRVGYGLFRGLEMSYVGIFGRNEVGIRNAIEFEDFRLKCLVPMGQRDLKALLMFGSERGVVETDWKWPWCEWRLRHCERARSIRSYHAGAKNHEES